MVHSGHVDRQSRYLDRQYKQLKCLNTLTFFKKRKVGVVMLKWLGGAQDERSDTFNLQFISLGVVKSELLIKGRTKFDILIKGRTNFRFTDTILYTTTRTRTYLSASLHCRSDESQFYTASLFRQIHGPCFRKHNVMPSSRQWRQATCGRGPLIGS